MCFQKFSSISCSWNLWRNNCGRGNFWRSETAPNVFLNSFPCKFTELHVKHIFVCLKHCWNCRETIYLKKYKFQSICGVLDSIPFLDRIRVLVQWCLRYRILSGLNITTRHRTMPIELCSTKAALQCTQLSGVKLIFFLQVTDLLKLRSIR